MYIQLQEILEVFSKLALIYACPEIMFALEITP